jgi:large subunit ribosomal protein L9
MDIILLKDVDKLGYKHEVVTVKNGFGRNYLIPQKLGIIANKTNRARLKELVRAHEAQEAKKLDFYKEIVAKLESIVLKIGAKAGTSGKIFGSVTNVQIAQALKDQFDVDIERRKIELPEDVKMLGTYSADLRLHAEVETKINFEVVAE